MSAQLLNALHEALEFIEDQADVKDGPDGEQVPNRAMVLAETLRAAIASATTKPYAGLFQGIVDEVAARTGAAS